MKAFEANFDGLVGPTHHYAGLSYGNVASLGNKNAISRPKEAALQGLKKMKALADLGLKQGVLPPQERPDLHTLRSLGFTGDLSKMLLDAYQNAPEILTACYSASSMWTANAATLSPSADTADGRVHFTPANLVNKLHRSIEPQVTGRILRSIFTDPKYFAHHPCLPHSDQLGDEGAANHTRFCSEYGSSGIEFFVYGRSGFNEKGERPTQFPARQTLEASEAIARLHGLDEKRVVYAQQNPAVIDQGVFHNDVIAVGNLNVIFHHEEAFLHPNDTFQKLQKALGETELIRIQVPTREVSVLEAVQTYLFNSQLVTLPSGEMALIAPQECKDHPRVWAYLESLLTQGTPIKKVLIYDVKQSMQNGGGPACLRLRVVLNESEQKATNSKVWINDELYSRLVKWVETHYRDELTLKDLTDPKLVLEGQVALDELTGILGIGSIYPFQLSAGSSD